MGNMTSVVRVFSVCCTGITQYKMIRSREGVLSFKSENFESDANGFEGRHGAGCRLRDGTCP